MVRIAGEYATPPARNRTHLAMPASAWQHRAAEEKEDGDL
jgi:hypothetical protein